MKLKRFLIPILPLAVLIGCTSLHNEQSGFLMDYANLKAAPGDRHQLADIAPDVMWSSYKSCIVDPVSTHFCKKCGEKISHDEQNYVADYFGKELNEVFAKDHAVATGPGAGTIRIRASVTDLDTSSTLVNLIAAALAWPVDYGGVTVEMEAVDSVTGKRLAAIAGYFEGSPLDVVQSFFKFGHTREGINKYVRVLHKIATPEKAKS